MTVVILDVPGIAPDLAVKLYPNPATVHIIVEGLPSETLYRLYDNLGKKVRDGRIGGSTRSVIETQGLPSGVYLLQLNNKGRNITVRCTINNR